MPTYLYYCLDCGKSFERIFSYAEYGKKKAICPHCNSENNRRKQTKVRIKKDRGERLSQLADPNLLDSIDNDPKALGKMMRDLGNGLEVDMPEEYSEVVDRLEAGQSPDEISDAIEGGSDTTEDDAVG